MIGTEDAQISLFRSAWRHLLSPTPWIVLIVSLSLSTFASYITWRATATEHQIRFNQKVDDLVHIIEGRLAAYRSVLHGAQGMFVSSEEVNRSEWRRYYEALRLQEFYPGIQGLGYAQRLRPKDVAVFEAAIRQDGFLDFSVSPVYEREIYSAIKFIEPFDWRNKRAFGFDMYSNPVRREAMEAAWRSGEIAISGPVVLLQETQKDVQHGFLMYLGFYRESADFAEKGEVLQGWVYAAFRFDDLMNSMLTEGSQDIGFDLWDISAGEPVLMFASEKKAKTSPQLEQFRELPFGGRIWQIQVYSEPEFNDDLDNSLSLFIFVAGIVESLSLFLMTVAFVATRDSARRQKELLQSLSNKNTEMEQFVYTVSHDLKSPLVSIQGYVEKLAASLHSSLNEKQEHWMSRIIFNVDYMKRLLADLLELSRVAHRQLEQEVFSFKGVLSEVLEGMKGQLDDLGAQLSVDIDVDTLCAQRRLLAQCLQNLLANAMQYRSPERGLKIAISTFRRGDDFILAVADNGIGIESKYHEKVFRIFERLSNGFVDGNGIGLSIIKMVMEKHGGSVSLHSEQNAGARFTLVFPRAYRKDKLGNENG